MRIAQGTALGLVIALSAWSTVAYSDEPLATLDVLAPESAVSDADLAGASGLGVSIDDTTVTDSDGSLIVLGEGNSAALAEADGTVNGEVIADTVTAGRVQNLSVQNMRGFNVVQVNTAQNANQIVSQAVNIYLVNSDATLGQ